MKRSVLIVGVVGILASLAGCFPEKRVVWSPDGRWAAVVGGDGLYICDDTGKLSPRVAEDVHSVAWMPDSRRLLIVREGKVTAWDEIASYYDDKQQESLKAVAEAVRREALDYNGDLDKFKSPELEELNGGDKAAVLLYLRDKRGAELHEKYPEQWAKLSDMHIDVGILQMAELDGSGAKLGEVIARLPDGMFEPRVSPDGQTVAFVGAAPGAQNGEGRLYVASTEDGRPARVVDDYVAWHPDWSPDGRRIIYAHTNGLLDDGDDVKLGAIAECVVRSESGALMDSFLEPEDLAGTVFQPHTRVRCLKDGRILFPAVELSLPCTPGDMPEHVSLFSVDPQRQAVVTRLITRQTETKITDGVYFFEVSPDEKHVSIAESEGRISVLDLAGGEMWTVVADEPSDKDLYMVPSWRSANELCCAVPPAGDSELATVALLTLDWPNKTSSTKPLSADWPREVTNDFLAPVVEEH